MHLKPDVLNVYMVGYLGEKRTFCSITRAHMPKWSVIASATMVPPTAF